MNKYIIIILILISILFFFVLRILYLATYCITYTSVKTNNTVGSLCFLQRHTRKQQLQLQIILMLHPIISVITNTNPPGVNDIVCHLIIIHILLALLTYTYYVPLLTMPTKYIELYI